MAIGQKTRPALTELTGFQLRQRNRSSSFSGDPGDRITRTARKEDDSVTAPGAAARLTADRTNRLWRTAIRVAFLQLDGCKKSDEPAVRRPQRKRRSLGAEERLSGRRTQRTHPQHGL